ncbi:hypothetical protein QE152_g37272 [Popillia japonica]|uniref:Uncharacterized protein n=1 Tax=Popillia japonica TaxID=7064 RepID=A0AAW1IB41_POPJA
MGTDIANGISSFNRKSRSYSFEKVQQFDHLRVNTTSKSEEEVDSFEKVQQFDHLRVNTTSKSEEEVDIDKCIAKSRKAAGSIHKILASKACEWKMLRRTVQGVLENKQWTHRTNNKLNQLYNAAEITHLVRAPRPKWFCYLNRMRGKKSFSKKVSGWKRELIPVRTEEVRKGLTTGKKSFSKKVSGWKRELIPVRTEEVRKGLTTERKEKEETTKADAIKDQGEEKG